MVDNLLSSNLNRIVDYSVKLFTFNRRQFKVMGCGVSKSQSVEDSSVTTSKDKNRRKQQSIRKLKSSLINHHLDSESTVDINNNQPKSSSTVHFDSSVNQHHHGTNQSISFPPPPTPHPKIKLLPRQLSRIEEINSETSSSIPSTSDAPTTQFHLVNPNLINSIACQTEFTATSVMTQTDPLPTPEEELEMLINCEYDFPDNFRPSVDSGQGSSMSNGFSSSSSTTVNNANGQLIIGTDGSLMVTSKNIKSNFGDFFEDFEISKRLVTPESRLVDVAIQVAQVRTSCSTQTNFGTGQGPSRLEPDHQASTTTTFVNPLKDEDFNDDKDNRLFHRLSTINHQLDQQRSSTISPTAIWSQMYNNQVTPTDNNQLISVKVADFESQTDPVTEVMAANAGDNDTNILQSFNLSSPFSHIEKQLGSMVDINSEPSNNLTNSQQFNYNNQPNDIKLQECLNQLLDDIEGSFSFDNSIRKGERKDASVQTVNDPITDEAPEFAARPPPSRKREMIPSLTIFESIDAKALEVPESACSSLISLVNYLISGLPNDMYKVRGIFRWIAHNIRYNWNYMGISISSEEILKSREGVCKDYCQLFGDMCLLAGIRVKKIQGFAKGYDYRPGHQFVPGEDITHNWNAVFILGSWRFVDLTWGTGYTDHSGKFQRKLNEHFFLTDPETMIWTHYPYNELEDNYSRWQLLDKPLTLDEFNTLPKVTPYFFEFNLKIRSKRANPINFRVQTEIKIGGHEAMRYKYKLYPADEVENASLNHYVFCQLKEDRMVGSFLVTPPIEGRYFLKVYARPEKDMGEWNIDATTALPPPATSSSLTNAPGQPATQSNLHSCVTFLLECSRSRKYLQPYPLNELPWGPTQSFYNYKMRLLNQSGPVVTTWGGKRRLVLESTEPMLITYQVLDAEGMEMDAKNLLIREDNGNRITFTISPPRLGMFKLMIFGMPKPKQKGKWRLPLLATFLIECKMAKIAKQPPEEEDPPPVVVDYVEPSMEYNDLYRQKFSNRSSVIR